MNWERCFAPHILERGYDYYCNDAVKNLKITEESIKADVIGTEDYEVEVWLKDGDVTDMYCSCPYAEDGKNCKHMAAVLYEWSGDEIDDYDDYDEIDSVLFSTAHTMNAYEKRVSMINDLVNEADPSDVNTFLVSVLAENEKLLLRFNNMVKKKVSKSDVSAYIDQIDGITRSYLGRSGFIDYYAANGFITELEDIIDNDVRMIIDNGEHLSAFEIMNYIFALMVNVDMDDSMGGTGILARRIYQIWIELLTNTEPKSKKKMFDWFISHFDGSIIDYLEEYMERIIMEAFPEEEYYEPKKNFVEVMIKKSEKKESDWCRRYDVDKWVSRYLEILEEQNASEECISEFCEKHWNSSSVRKYCVEMYIQKEDYRRALQILDESIELDKEYRGMVSEYSHKKKELYILQGDYDSYVNQLWDLVLDHDAGSVECFRELREQYSGEIWIQKREEIFAKLPAYTHIEQLYKEEKLYGRLLDFVLKSPGLYKLQEFECVLKKDYPVQLLDKYKAEISKMAKFTGGRKHYKDLISILQRMKGLEGGEQMVQEIVAQWRQTYRNRPAMMDELRKIDMVLCQVFGQ